jgi:membrane protease YdiL (CAAX protease family)
VDVLSRLLQRLAPVSHGGSPSAAAREALGLSLGLVLLLGISKPLLDGALGLTGAAFTLAAAWQLMTPLDRLDRARIHPSAFGIHFHGLLGVPLRILEWRLLSSSRRARDRARARNVVARLRPYTWRARLDLRGAARDLGMVVVVCLVTYPPFAVGYVEAQRYLASLSGHTITVEWQLPPDALRFVLTHVVVVAIPEELFYRGYIHTLLMRAWPPSLQWRGVSLGRAVLLGSALFAMGHFVGEWNPVRLLPFFPALLFCAMRSWSGSIMGVALYHGLCNVVGEVARVSVHWN